MEAAPALSTHQDEVIFARVEENVGTRPHLGLPSGASEAQIKRAIRDYYSVDEIVDFLLANKYRKITLQFPDSLICDSATVVHALQSSLKEKNIDICETSKITASGESINGEKDTSNCSSDNCSNNSTTNNCSTNNCSTNNCSSNKECSESSDESYKIWILADTSYSLCCIDEVAAEHVNSDVVIHFGDACLNPVDKLPAVYVFGKPVIDVDHVCEVLQSTYEGDQAIMLMADAPYTRYLSEIHNKVHDKLPGLRWMELDVGNARTIGYKPQFNINTDSMLNRVPLEKELQQDDLKEMALFHITKPEAPRLLQLTTKFSSVTVYEPMEREVTTGPFPNLMRRYRYMNVARSAGTVGVLVNTLSLSNTKKMIDTLGQKLKAAGKKHYVFVVGKPNVAKLANFEQIDIWCILGCDNQGIIIDEHNEFFKPIITPYELLLALSDDLTWTGQWETNFDTVLETMEQETPSEDQSDDESDEEPRFDPVTGRLVSTSRPLRQINHLRVTQEEEPEDESALVKKFSSHVAIKGTVSTAAQHLQTRAWTGLGSDYTEADSEGAELEEGRGGVARGYDYDVGRETR